MLDFSLVKSPKLKSLIRQSVKFSMLSKEEKHSTLEAIKNLSLEDQEAIYCPFFEQANESEKPAKDAAIKQLIGHLEETDRKIQTQARKDQEDMSKKVEDHQEEALLRQLGNF